MPVVTVPSLPDPTAPYIAKVEIDTPAEETNNDTIVATDHNSGSQGASASVCSRNVAGGVAREERERQIKLGLLLVRLGAAKEKNVFGERGLTVSPFDLLVINRPEDDAEARRPFKWYNPISWFLSGPRPSPILWSSTTATGSLSHPPSPPPSSFHQTKTTTETSTVTEAADVSDAALEKKSKKKRPPLPVIITDPLPDDAKLELVVQEERAKLLKDEEAVHRALDGIEKSRYAYLVPSQELRCEAEVNSVIQCYEKHNAAARSLENEMPLVSTTALPPVADLLQCGPVVLLLRQCAEGVVIAYGETDGVD